MSSSASAWKAFASPKCTVVNTFGVQILQESEVRGVGRFMHGFCLDLGEVDSSIRRRLADGTLHDAMAHWTTAWWSVMEEQDLYYLGNFSIPENGRIQEQMISHVSDVLVIRFDRTLKSKGVEYFDFGPYTSLYPIWHR